MLLFLKRDKKGVKSGNICNCDETNLSDDTGEKRALIQCRSKYPERIISSTKAGVSLMYYDNDTICVVQGRQPVVDTDRKRACQGKIQQITRSH